MVGFIFGGNTGETAESLARKRAVAQALIENANSRVPQSIGEGIASLGQALSGRLGLNALNKKEGAGRAAISDRIRQALTGGGAASTSPSASAGVPMTDAAAEVGATDPAKVDMTGNQVYGDFINTVKQGYQLADGNTLKLDNPYALAAVAATGKAESGYSPANANRSWSDPSASGQPGTAGGIMSWRGPRLQALYDFAGTNGEKQGAISPATQAKFFLQENPNLIADLNKAGSVEDAQRLMNNAWAFRGYDQPGGEAARRLSFAKGFLPNFQTGGGAEVASLDPKAGVSASAPSATAYVDPQVTTSAREPVPAPAAPAVAASVPTPSPAPGNRQVAQALTAPPYNGPIGVNPQLFDILSDPYISPGQSAVVRALIDSGMSEQQAARERAAKLADPNYQIELEKNRLEVDALKNPKISPADQANLDLNRDKFNFEKGKPTEVGGRLIGNDGKVIYEPPRDPLKVGAKETVIDPTSGKVIYQPQPGSAPADFNDISGLRKEIQQLPSYKNYSQALPIYRSMAETAGRNSKASDLNLVYGLGKIMDPTSVVREGEMVMVKNTASLPDWLQGAIASLNGGAALTPETRQAIMTEAFGRVQGYDQAFQQDTGQYKGIVERNKFNPADVIPDFGTYEQWKVPGSETDLPPAPEGMDPEDWKYLTPDQRRLWQK